MFRNSELFRQKTQAAKGGGHTEVGLGTQPEGLIFGCRVNPTYLING